MAKGKSTFFAPLLFVVLLLVNVPAGSATAGEPSHVLPASTRTSSLESILSTSRTLIGIPYRYGGMSKRGFDCSGLFNYVFESHGVDLARTSAAIKIQCADIAVSEVKAGDFLFFKGRNQRSQRIGHIALVSSVGPEGTHIIHATNRGVVEDILEEQNYYTKRLLSAGRRLDYDEVDDLRAIIPLLQTTLLPQI